MTRIFPTSFSGRSVFVTGHTGFKGSWLCLWLQRLGAGVTGYALAPPTETNNFSVSRVRDALTDHYEADIRDQQKLTQAIRRANPDIVLHLAAQSVVRRGYQIECRKDKHLWAQSPPYHFTRSLILTPSVSATANTVEIRGSDVR